MTSDEQGGPPDSSRHSSLFTRHRLFHAPWPIANAETVRSIKSRAFKPSSEQPAPHPKQAVPRRERSSAGPRESSSLLPWQFRESTSSPGCRCLPRASAASETSGSRRERSHVQCQRSVMNVIGERHLSKQEYFSDENRYMPATSRIAEASTQGLYSSSQTPSPITNTDTVLFFGRSSSTRKTLCHWPN